MAGMTLNFPYTAIELTQEVNLIPNTYGLLNEINLFPSEGQASRVVELAFTDGQIVVLSAEPTGAPGQFVERESGKSIYVQIPHFPMSDKIGPNDLQGLLEVIGGQKVTKTFDRELAKRLAQIRTNHALTREYIRLGALKGLIKDGKGRTLYDLFNVFGVTKKQIFFDLGTTGTDVLAKCDELFQYMAQSLRGETMSGVEVLVSNEFFTKLVNHASVKDYWKNWQGAQAVLVSALTGHKQAGGAWGRNFQLGKVMFREYVGFLPVRQPDGSIVSQRTIAAEMGHAYPDGTLNSFCTFDGPVHHINHVNAVPEGEVFVSPEVLEHGAGVELRSQQNALAICKRPELLVEVSTAAS